MMVSGLSLDLPPPTSSIGYIFLTCLTSKRPLHRCQSYHSQTTPRTEGIEFSSARVCLVVGALVYSNRRMHTCTSADSFART